MDDSRRSLQNWLGDRRLTRDGLVLRLRRSNSIQLLLVIVIETLLLNSPFLIMAHNLQFVVLNFFINSICCVPINTYAVRRVTSGRGVTCGVVER
eukprot:XP_001709410.1 Hypothetical protein GL50803_36975 [Giardia lamblia ATCC 50803]